MEQLDFFIKDKKELFEKLSEIEDYIGQCSKGVDITINEHKNRRTLLQNRFYWLNISDLCSFLASAGVHYEVEGREYLFDKDILHAMTKQKLGQTSFANKSTKEFSDIMEQCFEYWIYELTNGFWQPIEATSSYLERTGLLRNLEDGQ